MNRKEAAEYFNRQTEELLKDVRLRAEFEFEKVWSDMQDQFSLAIDPRMLETLKNVMRHAYISGAESGVLIMIEKAANDLCE